MNQIKRLKITRLEDFIKKKFIEEGLAVCVRCGKTVPHTLYCIICGKRILGNEKK
jgi:hypothetical protein